MHRMIYAALLAVALSLCEETLAQPSFLEHQVISNTTMGEVFLDVGDLDNDGDLDLVTAERNTNRVVWYENESGNFGSEIHLATEPTILHSVECADIDNDGDVDFLVHSALSGKISLFENTGTAQFEQHIVVADLATGAQIELVDIDHDGLLDVVFIAEFSERLDWSKNGGDNTFSLQSTIYDGFVTHFKAIDYDTDGNTDMVLGNPEGQVRVLRSLGAGNFENAQLIQIFEGLIGGFEVDDITGDGLPDVIAISTTPDHVHLLENQGSGSYFGNATIIDTSIHYPHGIKLGDLDNDGDVDILTASQNDSSFCWFENSSNALWQKAVISSGAQFATDIVSGDFDLDGDLDVIGASRGDSKIVLYRNDLVSGVNESESQHGLVFPNPTRQEVFLKMTKDAENVFVVDVNGAIVLDKKVEYGEKEIRLDLASLPKGLYSIVVHGGEDHTEHKIIKR